MSKPALVSLPLLALLFAAFLGCPSPVAQPPAAKQDGPKQPPEPENPPATADANTEAATSAAVENAAPGEPAGDESAAAAPSPDREAPAEEMPAEESTATDKSKAPGARGPALAEPVLADEAPAKGAKPAPGEPAAADSKAKPAGAQNQAQFVEGERQSETPLLADRELFVGWEKPKAAIVITGGQAGYIEPCGCAGLENQMGGLRRRHTFLKSLAARGWPVAAFDNGGLIRRFGQQAEIKFDRAVEGLKIMGYSAIGFGVDDLKLPAGAVASSVANVDAFVSANVGLFDDPGAEGAFTPQFRLIEVGGLKIGVTAVLGDKYRKQINNGDLKFLKAKDALVSVAKKLEGAECDYLVLLAYASLEETERLAEEFPVFDAVVTAGGADEPPYEPAMAKGSKSLLIEVGHKGMYAIVLGLYDDEQTPVRYQRVPLDSRFKDSPEMDALMVDYQDQLKQLGWEGLGLKPANHPRGKFAGSKACAECHEAEYKVWLDTPHAHATETLAKVKPPRQFDPECISCHAVGWNPQEFFPYKSGYESLKKTPLLADNGCENCHGPGADHVAAEKGQDEEPQTRFRAAMELSVADEKEASHACMECHDIDNSQKFNFKEYWPKVAH
ncbi:MAG TPA: multiheme c-type cytochrome [Pirellulales bacterium]|nr:multiheme c-type cytochrome [Pirellulales bacterium]